MRFKKLLVATLAVCSAICMAPQTLNAQQTMNNDAVIKLVKAGLSDGPDPIDHQLPTRSLRHLNRWPHRPEESRRQRQGCRCNRDKRLRPRPGSSCCFSPSTRH